MTGCRFAFSVALSAVLASSNRVHAQIGACEIVPGKLAPEQAETGLGPDPFCIAALTGDFVVGGANSRRFFGEPPLAGFPLPQTDPFVVTISGIPTGSTIQKAFANWSYLARDPADPPDPPYPPELAQITINSIPVTGTLTGEADDDLCWTVVAFTTRTIAYTADVTDIISQGSGNGTYTIGDAVDEEGALGEGFTLLIVYENPALPLKQVSIFSGMATTETGPEPERADCIYSLYPAPYFGGPIHFFINALDGQEGFSDKFELNGTTGGGAIDGTGTATNAWQGFLGQGSANSMYDHAEGDIASFVPLASDTLNIRTTYNADCIGLTQLGDDLFRRMSSPFHLEPPCPVSGH